MKLHQTNMVTWKWWEDIFEIFWLSDVVNILWFYDVKDFSKLVIDTQIMNSRFSQRSYEGNFLRLINR